MFTTLGRDVARKNSRKNLRQSSAFICCVLLSIVILISLLYKSRGNGKTGYLRNTHGAPAKEELGRAGWTILHRMAAKFSKKPTQLEQEHARDFLKLFALLYPCEECAKHFQKYVAHFPPDLSSNEALVKWMCHAHNDVNSRKQKPHFDCTMDRLITRWGTCGCEEEEKRAINIIHSRSNKIVVSD